VPPVLCGQHREWDGHLEELEITHDDVITRLPWNGLSRDVEAVGRAPDLSDLIDATTEHLGDLSGRLIPFLIHPDVVLGRGVGLRSHQTRGELPNRFVCTPGQ